MDKFLRLKPRGSVKIETSPPHSSLEFESCGLIEHVSYNQVTMTTPTPHELRSGRMSRRRCLLPFLSLPLIGSLFLLTSERWIQQACGSPFQASPPSSAGSNQDSQPQVPTISEFRPRSMLKVHQSRIETARFPAIDVHTHFRFKTKGSREAIETFVDDVMDPNGIALCVSLDATLGSEDEHFQLLGGRLADRFGIFVHLDFQGSGREGHWEEWACNQPQFVRTVVEQLKVAKARGCLGVKFFKQFGLGFRDRHGRLLQVDDPRFDPIWETCGELGMPVLIHTGDPAAFFEPIDQFNERAEELFRHPDWSFYGADFPSRAELLAARNRVIERHPKTRFIGAHVANNPEDLTEVGHWLDRYDNLYVDISSRIGELGRQPNTARRFFMTHADRILFGTDGPWPAERLGYYWRFLETDDEYFPYSEKQPPPQGLWFIYGLALPDRVLEKVYYKNALTILPGLQPKYQRYLDARK